MPAEKPTCPNLTTKEGALDYLTYHATNEVTVDQHTAVNMAFQNLLDHVWDFIPPGPGKTIAIRSLGRARMDCNSAIANNGG